MDERRATPSTVGYRFQCHQCLPESPAPFKPELSEMLTGSSASLWNGIVPALSQ